MAWVAADDFESDSTGNWNGQGNGTGWSGNWTKGTGSDSDFQIVSTPVGEGSRAASARNATNGATVTRALTSSVSGTINIYFLIRRNSTSASNGVRMGPTSNGGGTQYFVGFYGDALRVFGATGTNIVTGLSANTWYEVNIEVNTAASTYRARYRPQLGSWSSFTSSEGSDGGSTAALTDVWVQCLGTDSTIVYFDRISPTEQSSSTTYDETYTETITLVDTMPRSITRTLSDVVTLVGTFLGIKVYAQTLTETIVLTDTLVRSITRVITNAITLVDTLPRSVARTLTDTTTLNDVVTSAKILAREFTETITLSANFLVNGTNVIWGKITKSAAAVWTKINKN